MTKEEFIQCITKGYNTISNLIKMLSYEEILTFVAILVGKQEEELEQYPMGGYSKGMTSGAYQFVLKDLIKNIYQYDWLYEQLEDETSKIVFTRLIQFKILPLMDFLEAAYNENGEYHQYFDKRIVNCDENEVFVDCGGFIGDTTEDYINQFEKYKKIYVYEPANDNFKICKENLKKYENVLVYQAGVGEKDDILLMSEHGSSSTFMKSGSDEGSKIDIISLDSHIEEKVTFIKMDIEGFEIPAILGAKNHIKQDKPQLAICTYHIVSDIWEIPRLIHAILPEYKFYIRHYEKAQNWETVIYAIPVKENIEKDVVSKKRLVALAPYERGWSNYELLKDCGVIPYLLYKNHGWEAKMVGAFGGPYSNHEKYVNGIKMEFLENGSIEENCDYIQNHAKEIDCLLLRGMYPVDLVVAPLYKALNPNGRIVVGLDANINWVDRIPWEEENFKRFMDSCDVITSAGIDITRYLNRKWPWKVENILNGYYNFLEDKKEPNFKEKDNIILTVARIQITQKKINILLEAFSKIADIIPDWKLRLVGRYDYEPQFEAYKEEFFKRFPNLQDRVTFVGEVLDREKIYEEYRRAKIFISSSDVEGFPNAMAEAFNFGCVIATTKFDVYEEIINDGRCGMASEIDDVDGLANNLVALCQNKELDKLSRNAFLHGKRHFDMEKIVAKLNYMILGEE